MSEDLFTLVFDHLQQYRTEHWQSPARKVELGEVEMRDLRRICKEQMGLEEVPPDLTIWTLNIVAVDEPYALRVTG